MDNNSINQDNNPLSYTSPLFMPFTQSVYEQDDFFDNLPKEDKDYVLDTKHKFQSREELERFLYQRNEIK